MTKLIVSVRSHAESQIALNGGAQLIDIKEPSRGPLGAADGETVRAIAAGLGSAAGLAATIPLSVALGELLEAGPELSSADMQGVTFAKLGLSRCGSCADWADRYTERMGRLPGGVRPVAVIYADAAADVPPAESIFAASVSVRAAAILVDTFDKRRGGLLDHWPLEQVARFIAQARQAGLAAALAGSLDFAAVERLLPLGPDYIAVRGAVCRGGRLGPVEIGRVRRFARLLDGAGEERSASDRGHVALWRSE